MKVEKWPCTVYIKDTCVILPLCWFENIAKLRTAYKMEGLLFSGDWGGLPRNRGYSLWLTQILVLSLLLFSLSKSDAQALVIMWKVLWLKYVHKPFFYFIFPSSEGCHPSNGGCVDIASTVGKFRFLGSLPLWLLSQSNYTSGIYESFYLLAFTHLPRLWVVFPGQRSLFLPLNTPFSLYVPQSSVYNHWSPFILFQLYSQLFIGKDYVLITCVSPTYRVILD